MNSIEQIKIEPREIRKREHNIRCLSCDKVLMKTDLSMGTIKAQCPKCGAPIVITAKNNHIAVSEVDFIVFFNTEA